MSIVLTITGKQPKAIIRDQQETLKICKYRMHLTCAFSSFTDHIYNNLLWTFRSLSLFCFKVDKGKRVKNEVMARGQIYFVFSLCSRDKQIKTRFNVSASLKSYLNLQINGTILSSSFFPRSFQKQLLDIWIRNLYLVNKTSFTCSILIEYVLILLSNTCYSNHFCI